MGLRAALRQDPDVIMIGEMRDAETVDTAIKAAETGHLLMSTLHTPDAQSTILRIMAMFPPEEQDVIRIRLAESLYAVISQRLLPKRTGKGRAVAAEVMINTPAIKDLILEGTRIGEIRDFIEEGRDQYGMQSFDQCLADLVATRRSYIRGREGGGEQPVGLRAQDAHVLADRGHGRSRGHPPTRHLNPNPTGRRSALNGMQLGGGLEFLSQ